ncbi:MAG: hypothetical protein KC589_07170 [Nanoarchaeota archaeon]|nr:hypothetical protein [Nanoarchaeota archaeon]
MEIVNTEEQLVNKELSALFINDAPDDKEEIIDSNIIIYNDRKEIEIENDNKLQEFENDFQESRSAILDILETSKEALEDTLNIARDTDSSRGMEVASNMMNMISNVAKDLLELHERYDKIKAAKTKKQEESKQTGNNVYNNTNNLNFYGTSNDLLELIKKTKSEN